MAEEQKIDRPAEERNGQSGWRRRSTLVNLMNLAVGEKVSLADDAVGEVVENPRDGSWVILKYLQSPADEAKVGKEEPVFAEDVLGML